MKTDNQLRSEFRLALESVTPAAPWLAHAVSKSLDTRLSTKQNDQARPQLRLGLNVVAMLVLIGLVVAAVGGCLSVHPGGVPAGALVRRGVLSYQQGAARSPPAVVRRPHRRPGRRV